MFFLLMFFFSDTGTTEIYTYCHTLARHDVLPICYLLYIDWIALASKEGDATKAIFIRHGESTGNAGMPCHDLATIEATNRRARLPRACPKPTPQYHVTNTRTRQSAALLIASPRRAGRDVANRREL